jgi:hypothetical protein
MRNSYYSLHLISDDRSASLGYIRGINFAQCMSVMLKKDLARMKKKSKLHELVESVEHHVEEEEGEMFQKGREFFDKSHLEQ